MPENKIIIRHATKADIKSMAALLKELFSIETDFVIDATKQETGLELLLAEPEALVLAAEYENSVAGMCTVQTVISTAEGSKAGIVEDLVVSDRFRRQGIGQALLTAAEEWAAKHDINRLQLLADKGNNQALEFYASREWQPTDMGCLRKFIDKNNYGKTG